MTKTLRVLVLEDRPSDAELVVGELRRSGFELDWQRVDTEADFEAALNPEIDLILADYSLPQYDALQALKHVQKKGIDAPFIVITGSVGEEVAVECIKQGASDYLLKDRMARLGTAAVHAIQEKQLEKQKRSAEVALHESEALNRAVLNSMNAHIAVLDREGTIIAVNDAWDRYGKENGDPEQIHTGVGQNYLTICQNSAAAGVKEAKCALEGIQNVLNGRQSLFTMEYPGHFNGTKRWYSLYITPLQIDTSGAVVTHLDITERKLAEEQMRLQGTALQAAPTAMVIIDREGRIVWVNPAFSHLSGYSPVEAVGHYSRLVSAGSYEKNTYRDMWDTILAGNIWHNEILNRRKDGGVYTCEVTIAPVRDENQQITHFIDIEQDITERKQHERELEAIVIVANALRSAKTRSEMLPVIVDQLMNLLKAQGASICLYDNDTDEMVVTLARGPISRRCGERVPAHEGLIGQIVASREIFLSSSLDREALSALESEYPFDRRYAVAGVPLLAQEQLIGILWLGRTTEISLTEARILNAIADIAASAIYRASLYEETELRLQRLMALREIDKAITASLDLRVTLSVLVDQVISQLSMDAANVLLLTPQSHRLEYTVGSGFRQAYPRMGRLLGQDHSNQAVMERRIISVPNLSEDSSDLVARLRSRGDEFMAYFAVPLLAKGQVKGVLEIFKRTPFYPNPEWLNFLEMMAGQAAIAIDNAELFDNLQRSNINLAMAYDDTIEGWSRALDLRDRETEGHTQRVTEMTLRLATAAGIREADLVHLRRGALLHDIGKMGIADAILLKKEPLSTLDWQIIRKHPSYAYELLSPIEFLHPALDIPYCHHERWDGTGYPRGLKGEQIPLAARLFAVVDVYDALISDRVYRRAWDRNRIMEYIKEQANKHFDPQVVDLFIKGNW